ncbi:hypothetical protein McaMca56_003670 [Microsporum canis]
MCNQIAINVYCRPGDEVICDRSSHIINYEAGGPAANSGVMIRTIDGRRGIFEAEQVRNAIRAPSRRSLRLPNRPGWQHIWMATHMDGARLLNAVAATGISAAVYAEPFDSVWIDLRKGLGCPIGAVLCGSAGFVQNAWQLKQRYGGAMRQSGIVAAAGIYALDYNITRLAKDHANARLLAKLISAIPGVNIKLEEVETNLVYFEVRDQNGHPTAVEFVTRLLSMGVKGGAMDASTVRIATYLNINEDDIRAVIPAIREVISSITRKEGISA